MAEQNLFTYPEGWNEMLAALDFIPEEQREAFMEDFLDMISSICV